MQTGKRFRAYPTPPRNRSCSNGSETSGSSIMPRYRKTGMTGPSPKKRSLFPEYPFPSIRSMHVSSARTPPGSGMSPPRSSETGRFAGNRRWDDPFPESPEDPSSRKKTDGNRAGSLPSSSLFDIKTKPTPRSLFSEQGSSPWGIWSSRPIPHIPVPPPFTSWSRAGKRFASFSSDDGLLAPDVFGRGAPESNARLRPGRDDSGHGKLRSKNRFLPDPEDPDGEEGAGQKTLATKTLATGQRLGQPKKEPEASGPDLRIRKKGPEGCDPQGHP